MTLESLRSQVEHCLSRGLLTAATFYADKLVTLSDDSVEGVLLLARTYQACGEYRRALRALESRNMASSSLETQYLAGQCYYELGEYEACGRVLGEDDGPEPAAAMSDMALEDGSLVGTPTSADTLLRAAVCVLRGRLNEKLDNRGRATHWYKQALARDVHCVDALDRLVSSDMLTARQEGELFDSLEFDEGEEWLRLFYSARLRKRAHANPLEDVAKLESEVGLRSNLDVLAVRAVHLSERREHRAAHVITTEVLERDPGHEACVPVHVAALIQLKRTNDLFYFAHRLVDDFPHKAVSWLAVASYYLSVNDHQQARRYFMKATLVDNTLGAAWLGFGHSFAKDGEHDQAMAAYRTASRIFRGSHLPHLYIAMECLQTNQLAQAESSLRIAKEITPTDPLIYNELAVVYYGRGEFKKAVTVLNRALDLHASVSESGLESVFFNLGHAYRKLEDFPSALKYYNLALGIDSKNASTYAAVGLTYHIMGDLDSAIEHYHKSLGLRPEDTFSSEMLSRALEEVFLSPDL